MTIIAIARQIVDEKQAYLIRYRAGSVLAGQAQYDCKPLFTGKKKGWAILDSFSASALVQIHDALSPEHHPKFNNLPIDRLIGFAFQARA